MTVEGTTNGPNGSSTELGEVVAQPQPGHADEKTMRMVAEIAVASALATAGNGSGVEDSEPPPWRLVFPALLGIALLGIIAGMSVLFITVILNGLPATGNGDETVAAQIATGLALLGSLASAAVGGIAGMLTIALSGRRSTRDN